MRDDKDNNDDINNYNNDNTDDIKITYPLLTSQAQYDYNSKISAAIAVSSYNLVSQQNDLSR